VAVGCKSKHASCCGEGKSSGLRSPATGRGRLVSASPLLRRSARRFGAVLAQPAVNLLDHALEDL